MRTMIDPIVPGPCPPGGCPPPTEIVCIEVDKVYDFCFQVERKDNVCFDLPESCEEDEEASVTCTITALRCKEVSRAPLSMGGGFFNVTFLVTVTARIRTCQGPDLNGGENDRVSVRAKSGANNGANNGGNDGDECEEECLFERTFTFMKTVTLCAPEGTVTDCSIPSFTCGPCIPVDEGRRICCSFTLCMVIQSRATVKLLVPAYGFCVPAECVQVSPEFPTCPPENLFPRQCRVAGGAGA